VTPPVVDLPNLLWLGVALFVFTSLHSLLLWMGNRTQEGLGHLLAATALQGVGLLGLLEGGWPEVSRAWVNMALLAGAAYGLWAMRRYAGLPARMDRWGRIALGAWVLAAAAFHAMGFLWVQGLAVQASLALLALGISREMGGLARERGFRAPALAASALALAVALGALGAGGMTAYLPAGTVAYTLQTRAWFLFGILAAHQVFTLLLGQVQAQRVRQRLEALSATDPLTGLASAAGFRDRLDRAVGRSLRTGRPSSILVLDLDGFDALVEEHGPAPLLHMLEAFACTLNRTLREADLSGRLEGCRFAALLHHTPPLEALLAAERLRAAWENVPLTLGEQVFNPTLSGGVASTQEPIEGAQDLLDRAASRAACARKSGGNNVEGVENQELPPSLQR
jgi:diguanylate cyclase (GGDEF)-like protein